MMKIIITAIGVIILITLCGFVFINSGVFDIAATKPDSGIVRIGTSKDGNLRSRIAEHYQLKNRIYKFSKDRPKPSDRSVFRTNLGLALLNTRKDNYLKLWNTNFTEKEKRDKYGYRRIIKKEMALETEISEIIKNKFSFRYIIIDDDKKRINSNGFESKFIGTISNCSLCTQSKKWLGNHSPKNEVKNSGIWLTQHLYDEPIEDSDKEFVLKAIRRTNAWISTHSL